MRQHHSAISSRTRKQPSPHSHTHNVTHAPTCTRVCLCVELIAVHACSSPDTRVRHTGQHMQQHTCVAVITFSKSSATDGFMGSCVLLCAVWCTCMCAVCSCDCCVHAACMLRVLCGLVDLNACDVVLHLLHRFSCCVGSASVSVSVCTCICTCTCICICACIDSGVYAAVCAP